MGTAGLQKIEPFPFHVCISKSDGVDAMLLGGSPLQMGTAEQIFDASVDAILLDESTLKWAQRGYKRLNRFRSTLAFPCRTALMRFCWAETFPDGHIGTNIRCERGCDFVGRRHPQMGTAGLQKIEPFPLQTNISKSDGVDAMLLDESILKLAQRNK